MLVLRLSACHTPSFTLHRAHPAIKVQNLLYDISQIAIPFDRMDASEQAV